MKHIETAVAKRLEVAAVDVDTLLADLGLHKVSKSTIRFSSGNYTKYRGYARYSGGKIPAVERALKKHGAKVKYTKYDTLDVTLPGGIIVRSYPPYKDTVQVEVNVPKSDGNVESYHKEVISLLGLDKLKTGRPQYLTVKKKSKQGQLRLITDFTINTKDGKKKVDDGHAAVMKALKANKYVGSPEIVLQASDPKKTKTVYKNGSNSLVEITSQYKDSTYVTFHLFTPGSLKDLAK